MSVPIGVYDLRLNITRERRRHGVVQHPGLRGTAVTDKKEGGA